MAGPRVGDKAGRLMRRGGSRLALVAGSASLPRSAEAFPGGTLDLLAQARFDPQTAIGFALLMGLIIFATTTAILHLRERSRWARRERALTAEISALRGAHDRADMLMGSERQLV